MEYDIVIGVEIHAQIASQTKAYCSCEVSTRAFENTKVCEVCSAQPGTLPRVNREGVNAAIKSALAMNCKVNPVSYFDRKNYFYPDLPKGYQITQFATPIAQEGSVEIETEQGIKKVRIQRIQMEEDTGKSTHDGSSSYINLNRAGTQLIEIVTEPDLESAQEASEYFKKIRSILVYLGVSHGNMQEGNLRADVNISLKPKGSSTLGTRTEVKNINSFKNVEKAVEYEVVRHRDILNRGEKIQQQTLLFDAEKNETFLLREKSDADDYRYFPEPDLGPLFISDKEIQHLKTTLPELPDAKAKRFIDEYKLTSYDAQVLTSDKNLAHFFEQAQKAHQGEAKKMANWVMGELLRYLNESGTDVQKSPVSASNLAELLNEIEKGAISGKQAKDVFEKMYDTGKKAKELISELGLEQVSDTGLIEQLAQEVVEANPKEVEQYLGGRDRLLGFFVGQVMKKSQGKANPQLASDFVKKILDSKKGS